MRKFDKTLLLFISLIGFVFSVCLIVFLYPVPYLHDRVLQTISVHPWLNYVFTGYVAVIGLIFFLIMLILLFIPSRSNFLIIKRDKGELQFSKKAVESAAQYSFMDLKNIHASKIRVKLNRKPEKTKIYVKLFLTDANMSSLAGTVQDTILSSMQSSFGISINSVMVKTIEYKPVNAVKKDESYNPPSGNLL